MNAYLPKHALDIDAAPSPTEALRACGAVRSVGLSVLIAPSNAAATSTLLSSDALDGCGSVADLASAAGRSREGFTRRFSALCGMPPHAYSRHLRLNQARRMLRGTDAIADVAFECGFADQSHLGRCFRVAFGVTPAHYRRGLLEVTSVLEDR